MTKVADKTYHKLFDKPSEMIFTPEDEIQYNAATECHICDKRYSGLKFQPHSHKPGDNIKR